MDHDHKFNLMTIEQWAETGPARVICDSLQLVQTSRLSGEVNGVAEEADSEASRHDEHTLDQVMSA